MAHELSGHESLQGDTYFGGVSPALPVIDSGSLVKQSFESKPEAIRPPVRNESFDVNKELFRITNSDQKLNENSEPKPAQDDMYAADGQQAQPYPVDAPRRVLKTQPKL